MHLVGVITLRSRRCYDAQVGSTGVRDDHGRSGDRSCSDEIDNLHVGTGTGAAPFRHRNQHDGSSWSDEAAVKGTEREDAGTGAELAYTAAAHSSPRLDTISAARRRPGRGCPTPISP